MTSLKLPLVVVARLLLAAMFILSGVGKLGDITGTAGYIAGAGLPAP
ncbi:MAG: DoxX family membrane protein, partial [Rhizobacter sp.]